MLPEKHLGQRLWQNIIHLSITVMRSEKRVGTCPVSDIPDGCPLPSVPYFPTSDVVPTLAFLDKLTIIKANFHVLCVSLSLIILALKPVQCIDMYKKSLYSSDFCLSLCLKLLNGKEEIQAGFPIPGQNGVLVFLFVRRNVTKPYVNWLVLGTFQLLFRASF